MCKKINYKINSGFTSSNFQQNGVKFFKKESLDNTKFEINMLVNEVNVLNVLSKVDCVPKLIDYKFDEDCNYLVCEYIDGFDLSKVKTNSIKEAIILMISILDAVGFIHNYNIVHNDFKRSNIMVTNDNKIKIVDFSISLINNKNNFKFCGSYQYSLPEQILNENITVQSDIYQLGIIFYTLIFDKWPFFGTVEEIKEQKLKNIYHMSDNQFLNHIFYKTINSDINKRYKNVLEFKDDLKQLLNEYNVF